MSDNGSHSDIYEKVGRVEGTLNGLDKKIDRLLDSHATTQERLGRLEQLAAKATGIAVVISALVGVTASSIRDAFFHK